MVAGTCRKLGEFAAMVACRLAVLQHGFMEDDATINDCGRDCVKTGVHSFRSAFEYFCESCLVGLQGSRSLWARERGTSVTGYLTMWCRSSALLVLAAAANIRPKTSLTPSAHSFLVLQSATPLHSLQQSSHLCPCHWL